MLSKASHFEMLLQDRKQFEKRPIYNPDVAPCVNAFKETFDNDYSAHNIIH
jgi:hypothetical protein